MSTAISPIRRVAAALLAAVALAAMAAGGVMAGQPLSEARNVQFAFSFVDDEICPGLEIDSSFEGKRTRTVYYDREGNETRLVIHVQAWGLFTNVADPSLMVRSISTRNIVFNYADNTYTDTGVYRNVNTGGQHVLQQTGRWVESLDFDGTIYAVNGPHQDWLGDLGEFCGALGG